jgi:hypothetical protein
MRSMTRVAIVVSVMAVVAVAAAAALTVRAGRLEAEVERWVSANPHTLSGTRDILMLERYAEHFGDALRERYSGVSLIIAGDGGIEQAFTSPTRRETRLYLNKLIPENPFVWEERPLENELMISPGPLSFYRLTRVRVKRGCR